MLNLFEFIWPVIIERKNVTVYSSQKVKDSKVMHIAFQEFLNIFKR